MALICVIGVILLISFSQHRTTESFGGGRGGGGRGGWRGHGNWRGGGRGGWRGGNNSWLYSRPYYYFPYGVSDYNYVTYDPISVDYKDELDICVGKSYEVRDECIKQKTPEELCNSVLKESLLKCSM